MLSAATRHYRDKFCAAEDLMRNRGPESTAVDARDVTGKFSFIYAPNHRDHHPAGERPLFLFALL